MNKQGQIPQALIVEGNIGAGKSTLLKILQKTLQAQVVLEPHEQWQDVQGHNLLDKFYKDTPRWAYTFQCYAFVTRIWEQERCAAQTDHSIQILERSVYSDRYCFAQASHANKFMTDMEWILYKQWWDWFVQNYTAQPVGFVYLQVDPKTCYERIQKRSRSEEEAVPLAYIEQLHDLHESWLIDKKDVIPSVKNTPVLVVEGSLDFEHDVARQEEIAQSIINFFTKHEISIIKNEPQINISEYR
jgi:deoxyadenosine/deoxycytidine kinase